MNRLRALKFLLFFFFHQACGEEGEPTFRKAGHSFEMGYCFGVDYIVVYRSRPEGEQLLGNSSDDRPAVTPPADLQGRVFVSRRNHLLGLQIRQLGHGDSGTYRRECWKNQTRVKQHTHRLFVCDDEAEAKEFSHMAEGGRVELQCNANSATLQGASVSWYIELPPLYRFQLLLDSSVSLDPLVDELRGAVKVGSGGTSLSIDGSVLTDQQELYCLVMREKKCLLYQNMYHPIHSENKDVYALLGERVVLGCPFEDNTQQWETPVGGLNSSNVRNQQMHISAEGTPKTFSLVIPAVSDELTGEYSCITPSLELQFSLSLCPPKPTKENAISKDGSVLLECDVGQEEHQGLKWYRQGTSGEHELIHDTNDATVPVPDDLRRRMTLLRNGSSLRLSSAETEAGLTYSCVVLGGAEITLPDGGDYTDDYEEEETEDDKDYDDSMDSVTLEAHKCIFKQRNTVVLMKTTSSEDISRTRVTSKPKSNFETTSTPETGSNTIIPALAIGMVVLVLAGVIIAIVVTRRRAARNPTDTRHPTDVL